MRNRRISGAVALFLAVVSIAGLHAQISLSPYINTDVNKWIVNHFAKGKTPPFSFVYNGVRSEGFIRKWNFSTEEWTNPEPNSLSRRFVWQDAESGLRIECDVTGYPDFGAVEWVMRLTNTSGENTPVMDSFKVVDQRYESRTDGVFSVLHARGSIGVRSDFLVSQTQLQPAETLHLQPEGGRSSDHTAFPFFNIIHPDGKSGVVAAVGWTGGWQADITAVSDRQVSLTAGMERFHLYLKPGETVRTPRIVLVFWEGDNLMAGQNKFRRFQLAHHSRRIDGKTAEAPYAAGFAMPGPKPCTENGCLTEELAIAMARRMKMFNIVPEILWLDAGWYADSGAPNFDWCDIVGSWTPDTARFPRGLKPLADEAHRLGAGFLLWFEPERVSRFSWLANHHPEWLLRTKKRNSALLDLGNPDALQWLCHHVGDMIEQTGIDIYRQDFNHPGKPFWEDNEAPDRIGMMEIRHIEGLYAFWDYLIARFPRIKIDNCAAGGRRIDIEMMSRSFPLWSSDYNYQEPCGKQCYAYGLNFFLSQHGTGIFDPSEYSFRSALGASLVTNWDLYTPANSVADMQAIIAKFKQYRPYFYEDFYPLTGIFDTTPDDIWLAYQMHNPSDNSGIVLGFRRALTASDRYPVQLQGLDLQASYEVYNDNNGQTQRMTGKQMSDRLMLWANGKPGSILLHYKKVK
ncbi:MAG: alpha-galactosidase [Tannerella sp.]|jgi:alpha-galactosidase|nr:alpha-galactosidase [Tannerella sp.]